MSAQRERKENIPMPVEYFVHRYAAKAGKKLHAMERSALELLQSYSWPGNMRECRMSSSYGHIENEEDRADHLVHLRALQDGSRG
jgi:transcriptional regulator with PAS, ATPase and Fis domain